MQKIAAILLIMGIVGAVAGYGGAFFTLQPTITQLESQVDDLNSSLSRSQSELSKAESEGNLLTEALNISRSADMQSTTASSLSSQAVLEMGVLNATGAIALSQDASTKLQAILPLKERLIQIYVELASTVNGEVKQVYTNAAQSAKVELKFLEASILATDAMIPLFTALDEIVQTEAPTKEQKDRWIAVLKQAEDDFKTALQRFEEAEEIEPELILTGEKQGIRKVLDDINFFKATLKFL